MNILLISASHGEKAKHSFAHHFKSVCRDMGINVITLSPFDGTVVKIITDVKGESFNDYYIGKKMFPLSWLIDKWPENFIDFVFIENPKWLFDNDTDTTVVYFHRDMVSKVYCRNPDFLAIRFWSDGAAKDGRPAGGQPERLEIWHPEIWWDNEIKKIWLIMAISEDEFHELNAFKDKKRTKKNWTYYGSYISVRVMQHYNNTHFQIYKHHVDIINFIDKYNLAKGFRHVNRSLEDYKRHLFEYDATLIIPAWDSWETRRMYEASFCKCVPLLYIQNENARNVFKKQGYIHGKTCITFTKKEELLILDIYEYDLDKIRKNGYELVKNRHTYKARILELFRLIDVNSILTKNGKLEEVKDKYSIQSIV